MFNYNIIKAKSKEFHLMRPLLLFAFPFFFNETKQGKQDMLINLWSTSGRKAALFHVFLFFFFFLLFLSILRFDAWFSPFFLLFCHKPTYSLVMRVIWRRVYFSIFSFVSYAPIDRPIHLFRIRIWIMMSHLLGHVSTRINVCFFFFSSPLLMTFFIMAGGL